MKTENLSKASDSVSFLRGELSAAFKDAISSGNKFAEIAMLDALADVAKLEQKIRAMVEAAK